MHDDSCPIVELPICDPRGDEDVMKKSYDESSKIIYNRVGHTNVMLKFSNKECVNKILS